MRTTSPKVSFAVDGADLSQSLSSTLIATYSLFSEAQLTAILTTVLTLVFAHNSSPLIPVNYKAYLSMFLALSLE